jgi:hypothetical protein
VADNKFQSNAHIGKKLSNIFNRFYTFFSLFHTFFQIFLQLLTVFNRFKHEHARLVLPHLAQLLYFKALSIKDFTQNLPLPADKSLPKSAKSR